MDRSWMQLKDRLSPPYLEGINSFMEVAKNCDDTGIGIRCPCMRCLNVLTQSLDVIDQHLYQFGISPTYRTWVYHGEKSPPSGTDGVRCEKIDSNTMENDEQDDIFNLLHDLGMGQPIAEELYNQPQESDNTATSSKMEQTNIDYVVNLLGETGKMPFPGARMSSLNFIIRLMHIKLLNHWSNKSIDMLLKLLVQLLPECSEIPSSLYDAKKRLKDLGMGYETIHACRYDCVLFWKENESCDKCPICNEPRYKFAGQGGRVPQKVLRYFPLKSRLQRLFISQHTAFDMRWHKEKRLSEEGVLRHPADGELWKDFDRVYPKFAEDPRNVRLGLASDGFNPFGNMYNSYSMWPVILMPYNLPPWKCMKEAFMYMSLLIPGPSAPGRDIDVYLKPLVDELKELWEDGIDTYDAATKTRFTMHAALLWTINDFPAYANLSGWSTKGYLACPVCNDQTSSQLLRDKICYMGHRRYLPVDHPWRKNKRFNGKWEMNSAPKLYSGDDIIEQLKNLRDSQPGKSDSNKDRKRKRTEEELNWTKKSIFFELPYWSKLKLRHNLDVMHIEKNICDSLVGTLMNVDGKTKDTIKARMDLMDMNIRKELHLQSQSNRFLKPHASYTLTTTEKREFCKWLKKIQFPDGYSSNISRYVNVKDAKLYGLKSHDCHVLLERLLPIGIRPYLRKDVVSAIVELCYFFRRLCAKTICIATLDDLEKEIAIILSKFECIFPPAFFDIMVHLAIHLPIEAKYGGPVSFRWMYPIERALGRYKRYVKNKARPEGSIAEAYIINESLTFCSMYLSEIETKFNRSERNDDGVQKEGGLSVFGQNARPFGPMGIKEMSKEEIDQIHWFVLNNCDEVQQYLSDHITELQGDGISNYYESQKRRFSAWFYSKMSQRNCEGSVDVHDPLYILACGPSKRVYCYSGCNVNGVRFHIEKRDERRVTQNSGILVSGTHDDNTINFYGVLTDIIELVYLSQLRVVLFKCRWFDVDPKKKRIRHDFHLTSVNITKTWYDGDAFILATQARLVMYIDDPCLGDNWRIVEEMHQRGVWDKQEKDEMNVEEAVDNVYEDDDEQLWSERMDHNVSLPPQDMHVEVNFNRSDIQPELIDEEDLQVQRIVDIVQDIEEEENEDNESINMDDLVDSDME